MNMSNMAATILLIEDNPKHKQQIEKTLENEGKYKIEYLDNAGDENFLLNFKSIYFNSQIAIVDLKLRDTYSEGFELIENYLWKSDRTTYFVIFTESITAQSRMLNHIVTPHWCLIQKETDSINSNELNERCLLNLKKVVDELYKYSNPYLKMPLYNTTMYIEQINDLATDYDNKLFVNKLNQMVKKSIETSIDLLNKCSEASFGFGRSGMNSLNIGIGLFGSFGRLEARDDSDVEFCCYYAENENTGEMSELACIFWNRLSKYISYKGYKIEGEWLLDDKFGILKHERVPNLSKSRYLPYINIQHIIDGDDKKDQYLRNRKLQILTELKPVFNKEFINKFKYDIIKKYFSVAPISTKDIIKHNFMNELCTQFYLDTKPSNIKSFKDAKMFAYRVLHILSIKLYFIGVLEFGDYNLKDEKVREEFFDQLSSPSIIRLYFLYKKCKSEKNNKFKSILGNYENLFQNYIDLIEKIWNLSDMKDQNYPALRDDVKEVLKYYLLLIQSIERNKNFMVSKNCIWLYSTEDVKRLIEDF